MTGGVVVSCMKYILSKFLGLASIFEGRTGGVFLYTYPVTGIVSLNAVRVKVSIVNLAWE